MSRKPKKSTLKKKADNLVSLIVRSRGKCERCFRGHSVQLQCAHIVGRNNHTLRFDLKNALCLCAACHRWAHDNPDAFTDWWRDKYPDKQKYIDSKRNTITKRSVIDYQELVSRLKDVLDKQ